MVQEAGWAPGPVWTSAEILVRTRIRSPDRPARSKSLYRLSYPGPQKSSRIKKKLNIRSPCSTTTKKNATSGRGCYGWNNGARTFYLQTGHNSLFLHQPINAHEFVGWCINCNDMHGMSNIGGLEF